MYPNLDLRAVNLCWKDAEGDNVVFSTDEELREAMNAVQGDVIRIYLVGKHFYLQFTQPISFYHLSFLVTINYAHTNNNL